MQRLNEIAIELKQELYGIDNIIDRVIKSISGWYIAPEIVTRPVIINLWGMTGVGKTDLVRKLVQKLDFQQRFVEIQMDGGLILEVFFISNDSELNTFEEKYWLIAKEVSQVLIDYVKTKK